MNQRYGQMTKQELTAEVARLNELAKKAEQKGMVSEFAVHERKKVIAQSYLLNPDDFNPGETYTVGEPDVDESSFVISYMNGVFAWGYRDGEASLSAIPIALLTKK
ncbi:YfhH family protein [Salicibibacter cibi]|nr:YfhH family protein [Salicibibacter cibi]